MKKSQWYKLLMQIMMVFIVLVIGTGCSPDTTNSTETPPNVPESEAYVVVNDNIPYFTDEDITSTEAYAE